MHTQFQLGEIQLITPFFLVSVNLLNAPLITCIHTCVFSVCTVKKKLPHITPPFPRHRHLQSLLKIKNRVFFGPAFSFFLEKAGGDILIQQYENLFGPRL